MFSQRVFRLFLSSTFSDFIPEREALQERVYPKLESLCRQYGATFEAVDLRWGITEEAQRSNDTMRICLEEIRRCQKLSPRPNFAVLLGDRYGWEPAPAHITEADWVRLKAASSPEDWDVISNSYRADLNSVPTLFCLCEAESESAATPTQRVLVDALRRAASDFQGADRLPYFASATHQEIALGALSDFDSDGEPLYPDQHVQVYIRKLSDVALDSSCSNFLDWDEQSNSVDAGARDRLKALKFSLKAKLPNNIYEFSTSWKKHGSNGAVDHAYLDAFCDAFLEQQTELIHKELSQLKKTSEIEAVDSAHNNFALERSKLFIGRDDVLKHLNEYLSSSRRRPYVLSGKGGSGKSALMAHIAKESAQERRDESVHVQRYIGAVSGSESLSNLLSDLILTLRAHYDQDIAPLPSEPQALSREFHHALSLASSSRPLFIFIDAIDQLDLIDDEQNLSWLPTVLPNHVKIITSMREDSSAAETARARWTNSVLPIPPFSPEDGERMLDALLYNTHPALATAGETNSHRRTLTVAQRETILESFSRSGSPLWLKLVFEQAQHWPSWYVSKSLAPDLTELISGLFQVYLPEIQRHPRQFVANAIAFITASKYGISEKEINRALGTASTVRSEFLAQEKTQKRWENPHSLPPVLWARLFSDLSPFLGVTERQGARLMNWYHPEFNRVAEKLFLSEKVDREQIHSHLANIFYELELEQRPAEISAQTLFKLTDASSIQASQALRRIAEQPWQLRKAGKEPEFVDLLSDFSFCMAKAAANDTNELIRELKQCAEMDGVSDIARAFEELAINYGPLLNRGNTRWPAHKILFQLAAEQPPGTPLAVQAHEWLDKGFCDWIWIKQKHARITTSSACRSVIHTAEVSHQSPNVIPLPDHKLLTWMSNRCLVLWEQESGEKISSYSFPSNPSRRRRVKNTEDTGVKALRSDPTMVLTWSTHEGIEILNALTGKKVRAFTNEPQSSIARPPEELPDQKILFICEHQAQIGSSQFCIWDSNDDLTKHEIHSTQPEGFIKLNDGNILSWAKDHDIKVWCPNTGHILASLTPHAAAVRHSIVLAENRFAVSFEDGLVRLWTAGKAYTYQDLLASSNKYQLTPLSNDRLLLWDNRTVTVYNSRDGQVIRTLRISATVRCVLQTDDDVVTLGCADGTLRHWNWRDSSLTASTARGDVIESHIKRNLNGEEIWQVRVEKSRPIIGLVKIDDSSFIAWGDDHTLRYFDLKTKALLGVFEGHTSRILSCYRLNETSALSSSEDGTVRIWDLNRAQEEIPSSLDADFAGVLKTAGKHFINLRFNDAAEVLDGRTGNTLCNLPWLKARQVGGRLHSDPYTLVDEAHILNYRGRKLELWNLESGKITASRDISQIGSRVVKAFQTRNNVIVLALEDNKFGLWSALDRSEILILSHHSAKLSGALSLSNGDMVTWDERSRICLWEPTSGQLQEQFEVGDERIQKVTEVNSRYLVCHSSKKLIIWNTVEREVVASIEGDHRLRVQISGDDKHLAFWEYSGPVYGLTRQGTILKTCDLTNSELNWSSLHIPIQIENALFLDNTKIIISGLSTVISANIENGRCLLLDGNQKEPVGRPLLNQSNQVLIRTPSMIYVIDADYGEVLYSVSREMAPIELSAQFNCNPIETGNWTEFRDGLGVGIVINSKYEQRIAQWHTSDRAAVRAIFETGDVYVESNGNTSVMQIFKGSEKLIPISSEHNTNEG